MDRVIVLCFAVAVACLIGAAINMLADGPFGDFLERHLWADDDDFNGNGRHPRDAFPHERSHL